MPTFFIRLKSMNRTILFGWLCDERTLKVLNDPSAGWWQKEVERSRRKNRRCQLLLIFHGTLGGWCKRDLVAEIFIEFLSSFMWHNTLPMGIELWKLSGSGSWPNFQFRRDILGNGIDGIIYIEDKEEITLFINYLCKAYTAIRSIQF